MIFSYFGLYFNLDRFFDTIFNLEKDMGQQLNKIEKRRRRKAYLERCRERAMAAASKKK